MDDEMVEVVVVVVVMVDDGVDEESKVEGDLQSRKGDP